MEALQNLAIFILVSQLMASIFLMICYAIDSDTFHKIGVKGHAAIPFFRRIVGLLRNTRTPLVMGLSFLSLVFVVLSYAGVILAVVQLVRLLIS